MDVHIPSPQQIAELLVRFPILLVLLGGIVFGAGTTQLVKKAYQDWNGPLMTEVSMRRYRFTVRTLSAASTYAFTLALWHWILGHGEGEEIISIGTAGCSPLVYDGLRAIVKWKWPGLAASWSEHNRE